RVEATRQAFNEFVGSRELRGSHYLGKSCIALHTGDVLSHCAAKQKAILQHHTKIPAQMLELKLPGIVPVNPQQPLLHWIHSRNQARKCRLTRAAATDNSKDRARRN